MMSLNVDNVTVRDAVESDMEYVAQMIQELADFEKMSDGPKLTVEDLKRDGFHINPQLFRCKIAEENGHQKKEKNILGYALYFNTYSTWEGKALMMEDLYVKMNQRKRGVGKMLLKAVAKEAVDTGCKRLDFHVLKWNVATKFYENLGAVNLTETEEWLFYRLSGKSLLELAAPK